MQVKTCCKRSRISSARKVSKISLVHCMSHGKMVLLRQKPCCQKPLYVVRTEAKHAIQQPEHPLSSHMFGVISDPVSRYVQVCRTLTFKSVGISKRHLHNSDIQYVFLCVGMSLCAGICRYLQVCHQHKSRSTCTYMQYLHIVTYLHIPVIPSDTCNTFT